MALGFSWDVSERFYGLHNNGLKPNLKNKIIFFFKFSFITKVR